MVWAWETRREFGRDFAAFERRRMRAASLLAKGLSQSEVARQVGAHRQSVSKWAAELEAKGRAGLKKAGRAGRKPRLSAEICARSSRDSNAGRKRWAMKPVCGRRTGSPI